MQGNLPLDVGLLYECANPDCFHCGTLLNMHETSWKDVWDSNFEDLVPIPICPACNEPQMIWEGEDDGT